MVCFVNYNNSPPEKVKFSHKLMSWGIVVLFDITKVKSQESVLCIFSVLQKLNILIDEYILKSLFLMQFSVSPCSPNPCMNDGSCSVDVNYEATCACNGEWSGFYCSG